MYFSFYFRPNLGPPPPEIIGRRKLIKRRKTQRSNTAFLKRYQDIKPPVHVGPVCSSLV